MARNQMLGVAKQTKQDEYYTLREAIEVELMHYADQFEGKSVYCNCDDPEWSEFWQFFKRMFVPWSLKSLTATHYETETENYSYRLDLADTNGDGTVDWKDDPVITQIEYNGDFRNQSCIDILDASDIIVTNPPFSLIREYIAQLIEHEKKFLIICPLSGIKYKETFPYLRDGKLWLGYTKPKKFRVPDGTTGSGVTVENGTWYKKFGNTYWITNLYVKTHHERLDTRGVYYSPERYQSYTNFDGIDVPSVSDIPCDWDGNMGVPISYMERHNPEQYEVIGLGEGNLAKEIGITRNHEGRTKLEVQDPDGTYRRPFARIVIRKRK